MGGELGRTYANGEVIFREGEKGDTLFVIQAGSVTISKQGAAGPMVIATLGKGEIFGEMALFDKLPRSATAAAAGEARVLSVDKQKLFSGISHDPTMVFKILETMSGRIRRLNENLAGLAQAKSGSGRMLHFNTEDTCRLVLDQAREMVRADNGSIMLVEEGGGRLAIQAAFGTEAATKFVMSPGVGIAGDVITTGKAELVNDASRDPRFRAGELPVRSLLCAPLKCASQIIGVINMSSAAGGAFSLDDLKTLHTLSSHASVAIQNARSFSSLRTAADRLLMHVTMLEM